MIRIWRYPDTMIAVILVVGCFVLLGMGVDGEVKSILCLAGGWAFGSGYQARRSGRAPV